MYRPEKIFHLWIAAAPVENFLYKVNRQSHDGKDSTNIVWKGKWVIPKICI